VLAGFELLARRGDAVSPLAAAVGWLDEDSEWHEEETVVTERLMAAALGKPGEPAPPPAVRDALDRLIAPIRARLALAGARRWTAAEPESSARRLAARLGEAVHDAVRRRDGPALACLERALAFATGGHTAGEAMLVKKLADSDGRGLAAGVARLPAPTQRWETVEVRVTGVVLFGLE